MKLIEQFDSFLKEVVDLNTTRIQLLEESVTALKSVIRSSDWEAKVKSFAPQGSWAHKTIIKPIGERAFDADLLVFVEPVSMWDAKKYLSTLRAIFANNTTYEDKVRRFSHCITIEYVGERKIDIAPCVVNRQGVIRFEVCNFNTNSFELSEPEKYTELLIERNGWTGGNTLRKVTRLLKYLRDIKGTFSCPSVLLTTLLGMQITLADKGDYINFADVPTALKTILGRLDDWLQLRAARPAILNPVLSSEDLGTLLDDTQYSNFRVKIHTYRAWVDEAYAEPDRDESIGKWRRVFGEEFAKGAAVEKAASISDNARKLTNGLITGASDQATDLVALFARFGPQALPADFDRLPHKQRPQWRALPTPLFSVEIVASRYSDRNGTFVERHQKILSPLPKNNWLRFDVRAAGSPLGQDFQIYWRVTNTDREAWRANALRGGFEKCNDGSSRWEQLQYRGVHTVEAFIIRNRDQLLVAQSKPFYVVIA